MAFQRRKKTAHIPGTKAHQKYYVTRKDGTKVNVPGGSWIAHIAGAWESERYLIKWANQLGLDGYDSEKYRDKLADVGTLTHAMALETLSGKSYQWLFDEFSPWIVDEAKKCFKKFEEWAKDKEFNPIVMEEPLVSDIYEFGGTLDFFGGVRKKGESRWRKLLLDWKTSKYIYKTHLYQVAGYQELLFENGYENEFVGIFRMGRRETEGFQYVERTAQQILQQWEIFRTALQLYHLQMKEPKYIN